MIARGLFRQRRLGLVVGNDLAIDPGFAHAPRDQLGDLAAEINNQTRSWSCAGLVFVRIGGLGGLLAGPTVQRAHGLLGGGVAGIDRQALRRNSCAAKSGWLLAA